MAAWQANKLSFASRLPKLPSVSIITTAATQSRPEYQPAPQTAVLVRESFAEEKKILPQLDIIDEQEPPSRADLAYEEEFNKWTGLIEAAAKDKGVPKAQRRANVQALRDRQCAAANAVRKRVREEEQSAARARHRAKQILLGLPEPPQ